MSYPWKSLSPKDGYQLRRTSFLSDLDRKVLTLLYQPIIGPVAYSLLMTWWSETDQQSLGIKEGLLSDLLSIQNIGIPEFYDARVHLEAIGLLKTYSQNGSAFYVYELMPPLSPRGFLEDDILQLLLLNRIGENRFKQLKKQFLIPKWQKESFEEVTRSFPDVYSFDWRTSSNNSLKTIEQSLENDYRSLVDPKAIGADMEISTFDWTFFSTNLSGQFISRKSVSENRNVIQTLHTIYGIDELKMSRYVLECADPSSGKIDPAKLKTLIHRNHRGQAVKPAHAERENNKNIASKSYRGVSSQDAQLLQLSEKRNPADFLISIKKQKGGFLTKVEQWTLEDIVSQSGLSTAVINILIHYILVIKENAVFERNLAYKIANDWAQNQVTTPEKAMEKVRQLYEKNEKKSQISKTSYSDSRRNVTQKSTYRKETLPEWATETAATKQEDEPLSEEEQQAFKERLKKIRNFRKEGE